ncbi:UTP--glucose-1-phosphate uridylyltransferase 3, chloroplastic isoform X2 [Populus alba]|uniref:UTP--glucose-1-phosphate uridylyltransferase 3, chloroplastic isoform X2 n=1 Tax=Populus alba TaxID=43335 RepID=UPI00158BDE08|nr:UTP--glucose-1-phosphate uridylyltransferase 3, chloroplastic isoform X2 [Populus alba]
MAKTNAATSSSTDILLRYNNKNRNDFLFSFNSISLFNKSLPFKRPSLPPPLLSLSSSPSKPLTTRVSIAPVEYAPPAPDSFNFHQEISRLQSLRSKLAHSKTLNGKHSVLNDDSHVKRFFKIGGVSRFLDSINLTSRELFLLKCLVAAGQEHVVSLEGFELVESEAVGSVRTSVKSALYNLVEIIEGFDLSDNGNKGLERINYGVNLNDEEIKDLKKLLKSLGEVEEFYDCIGGVIGYQIMVLELLFQSTFKKQTTNWSQHIKESMECQFLEIHAPSGLDLSKNTEYASQAALWGIEGLPDLGEIYPLGGSADRLGLVDPDTGECLPAAMLPYCGRTLLEGLIRDLQAREFLYFKIYGKQCITPVAIMTSSAKNNHEHITSLCERLSWFGRAVSAEDGQWLVTKPFAPVCKPGGHGVIWKLAYDKGIFEWFYDHDRKGATVRQVSNVVAATDLTLLALAGIGLRHRKKLGFASCKRNSGATEGINVLIEKKNLDGQWAYGLSCIEYTEFDKFEITGSPCSTNGLQAEFPANTNILYVDLPSLELVASSNNEKSLPGMVLNTKKPIVYMDHYGNCHSVSGGRLECTMQNIADNFTNTYLSRCYKGVEDKLDTFIVYNERRRVTSSAKRKRRHSDNTLHQTPDGALLDILRNAYDLLSHCDIELPQIEGNDKYVDSGPPFLIFLHPALGPLWEVTRQKFNGGSISKGSELQIEVAEFSWRNVQLDGSLIIIAENVMGSTRMDPNGEPILQYGNRCGRCRLQNVKVVNKGINWSFGDNIYWKHDVQRFEALKVILHGNAEFEADNVTVQGNQIFEIPDGYKMKITSGDSGLQVQLNPLEQKIMDSGSWHWNYKIHGPHIRLGLVET